MTRKIPQDKKSNFYFSSEAEAKKVLEAEGKRLRDISIKVWRKYLASYQPTVYARTGDSEKGINIGIVKNVGTDTWGIEVTFKNDLMYHDSVVKGKKQHPQGHSIMLISSGWHSKKLESKIGVRKHFTKYKGFNYLGQVVKEFNAKKHKGISLELQWSGKYLNKK